MVFQVKEYEWMVEASHSFSFNLYFFDNDIQKAVLIGNISFEQDNEVKSHKSCSRGQRDKPNMACKEVGKEFQYGQCLRMQPLSTQPYHTS